MNQSEILKAAGKIKDELIERFPEHEEKLRGVDFVINSRLRTTAGTASHRTNTVEFSRSIFAKLENEHNFKNTCLHEIAHLLVGPKNGHNRRWKMMHKKIGGNAERCHKMACDHNKGHERSHKVTCENCGEVMAVTKRKYKNMMKIYNGGKGYYKHNCGGKVLILNEI